MNETQRQYKINRALTLLEAIPQCGDCDDAWGAIGDSLEVVKNGNADREKRIYHTAKFNRAEVTLCGDCFARWFYMQRLFSLYTEEERRIIKELFKREDN